MSLTLSRLSVKRMIEKKLTYDANFYILCNVGVFFEGSASIAMSSGKTRESVDLWPFILERVQRADEDMSWWPEDEMRHWSDEGDEGEIADLSEIEDSDDEGEAEQDWEFLRDWGKKFENLNKLFNPEDEDEEEETEA